MGPWRKPYALVSGIIIGYIIISIYEVFYKPSSDPSDRVPSGPPLYSFPSSMASCDKKGVTVVAEVAGCSSTVLLLNETLSLGSVI